MSVNPPVPAPTRWVAFGDESMRSLRPGAPPAYLLAAAVIESTYLDIARDAIGQLAPRSGVKFHWKDADDRVRDKAVGVVTSLDALHYVVVGTPLEGIRQERARRLCLCELLCQLEGAGIGQVWMESRREDQDSNDIRAVKAFRRQKRIGTQVRVDHAVPAGPAAERLLWIPDIVAGAVNQGRPDHLAALAPMLIECPITLL